MGLYPPFAVLAETIVSALAGLLGVVVGAMLGWWRERQDRKGKTLSAARLVDAELAATLIRLNRVVASETRLDKSLAPQFETPAWAEMRAALALGLQPDEWNAVRDAFATVSAFRISLQESAHATSAKEQGRDAMDLIAKARNELTAYCGTPRTA
jgi:hypothetical protein